MVILYVYNYHVELSVELKDHNHYRVPYHMYLLTNRVEDLQSHRELYFDDIVEYFE